MTPSEQLRESLKEFEKRVSYPSDNSLYSISDEQKLKENPEKHFYYPDAYPESIWELDPAKLKHFFKAHTLKLLEAEKERLECERVEMKEHHFCRFNDGDCNCECYLDALQDQISHLEEEIKKIKE